MNDDLLYRLVGENIRGARERSTPRISQTQLAKRLNMNRVSIVNIEAGRQRAPLHVLWHIAEVLAVEVTDLIPSQAECNAEREPMRLDDETIAQIEIAANGNTDTKRDLMRFVAKVKAQAHKP